MQVVVQSDALKVDEWMGIWQDHSSSFSLPDVRMMKNISSIRT